MAKHSGEKHLSDSARVSITRSADQTTYLPVAADGSYFHRGLERNGGFMIGAKGVEIKIYDFREAVAALQRMETARWRRPNKAMNWGIVAAREWNLPVRHDALSN
jgi:hypothetical protein